MNDFLAEMYGTRETIGAGPAQSGDVEKLAEAQLLDEALRAEGVDVDQLPADAIVKVAYELFGEDSALVKAAAEGEEDEKDEEGEKEGEGEEGEEAKEEEDEKKEGSAETFEEKLAQADLLGRAMAHSFVQEQDSIMKEAGKEKVVGKGAKALLSRFGKTLKSAPGKALKKVQHGAKATGSWAAEPIHTYRGGRQASALAGKPVGRARAAFETAKAHPGQTAAAAGGLAAVGGGAAFGAHKAFGKKKESSALEALAERRAMEILKEAGMVEDTQEEKLASAVEQRAWEMLQENGYTE